MYKYIDSPLMYKCIDDVLRI